MSQQNIKQIIKQEYLKCAKDPVYFMKKYCMIQHPTRGRIQFNLFTFQEKVLGLLNKNERNIILKSRQLGISTLSAGMSLWYMLFQKDINVLVIASLLYIPTIDFIFLSTASLYSAFVSLIPLSSIGIERSSI